MCDWSSSVPFNDPVSSTAKQHGPDGQQQQVGEWTNEEANQLSVVIEASTDRGQDNEADITIFDGYAQALTLDIGLPCAKVGDACAFRAKKVDFVATLVIVSVIFAVCSGTTLALGSVAAALLLLDVALTVTRQLPSNTRIQSWTEVTISADWS